MTDSVNQAHDFTASALSQVRIVLVHPRHPGNIGAAARALKNMGLSRLIIVGDTPTDHPEARAMSSGALDLLRRAERVTSLHAAACRLVTRSARRNRSRAPEDMARASG